ncbi:hypothetical protein JCM19235_3628 [Vibrio maritimus]|uniref:Uncharacterized protein n=1 Tax=Vibrio maritimus TaxID=990268 RepID=A0A090RZB6_9VIBR|nr:hypothetical protein JCM19235_3628 [Vibrio maritimus]
METQVSLNHTNLSPKNKVMAILDRVSQLDTIVAASLLAVIVAL